jgi:cytochrome c-type biogenesis protein CcmH/NrfG
MPRQPAAAEKASDLAARALEFLRTAPGDSEDDGLAALRAAANARPDDAGACFELANAYCARGEHGNAVVTYREATRLDPFHFEAWNNCGFAHYCAREYAEAARAFERALSLDPACAQVWFNLARALAALGRLDGAQAALREAIRLEPGYAAAQGYLATLRARASQR